MTGRMAIENISVGEKIKKYRFERGISQDKLAKEILVSRQTISNWENNKTIPDIENLILISIIFDISLNDLLSEHVKDVEIQHNEKKLAVNFIYSIFILVVICILSIIFSIKISKYLLSVPFVIMIIIIFFTFIFDHRLTGKKSYIKPISTWKIILLLLAVSIFSFFSVYFILDLL